MIIQTGMRTDIPAFYSEWFANRMKQGIVCTRNPYYPNQVTVYKLTRDVVDIIAFCTKNPAPMFQYMDLLEGYGQYWFVTITPYGKELEPNVPGKEFVMEDFKKLSKSVGIDSIGWRYDPIIVTDRYTVDWHIFQFEKMASNLAGYTNTCVISFVDLYKKLRQNFPEARSVARAEREQIGKKFVHIAKKYGMILRPCAEGEELAAFGADCSGCMTKDTFETAIHGKLNVPKIKSQRGECACLLGKDIGQYNTCGHLCRYCYANFHADVVRKNMGEHDPASPFLIGWEKDGDKVHYAKQKSWIDRQLSFHLV